LLRGILQPPFKDRKDPEYFARMKKAQELADRSKGINRDSEEGDDLNETSIEAIRKRNRNKVQDGPKAKISYEA